MFASAAKVGLESSLENKNKESNHRFPTFITDINISVEFVSIGGKWTLHCVIKKFP